MMLRVAPLALLATLVATSAPAQSVGSGTSTVPAAGAPAPAPELPPPPVEVPPPPQLPTPPPVTLPQVSVPKSDVHVEVPKAVTDALPASRQGGQPPVATQRNATPAPSSIASPARRSGRGLSRQAAPGRARVAVAAPSHAPRRSHRRGRDHAREGATMPRRARAPAQRIVALRRGTPWALTHAPAWMGARAEQSSGGHHHGGGNALMPSLDTASGRWVLVVLLASIQLALLSIASLRREHFRRHRW